MGKQYKQWETIFLGSKIPADGDCSHEIKRCLAPWKKSYDKARQNIKKERPYFANKGLSTQSYGFLQLSYADVRVGPYRRLRAKELMLLNCGTGEDSWESLELQREQTSQS